MFSAHILVLASAPVLTSTSTASSPTIPLTSIFMPLLRLSEHHVHTTPSRAPLTLFSRLSTTVPTIISDAMFTTPPHTRTLHASISTIFTTVSTPSRTPGSDDSSHAHPSRSSHNFFTTFFTTFPHDSSVILSPQRTFLMPPFTTLYSLLCVTFCLVFLASVLSSFHVLYLATTITYGVLRAPFVYKSLTFLKLIHR